MESLMPVLLSIGLPIGLVFFVFSLLRDNRSKISGAVKEAVHSFKQDKGEEKIESIEREQNKVVAHIKKTKELDVETKKKIREITDSASDQIEKVQKASSIKEIQNTIDSNWGDI